MKSLLVAAGVACLLATPFLAGAASGGSVEETEVWIEISPKAVVLGSNTTWVTIQTTLPHGTVSNTSLTLDGLPVAFTKANDRGYLVAKFRMGDVKGIVTPPEATLELRGESFLIGPFVGRDTVRVISGGPK